MMDKFRERADPYLRKVGIFSSKLIPIPWIWTLFGLIAALFSCFSFILKLTILAGFLILISGIFDLIDGSVARALGKVSKKGAFIDSNVDRISEVFIFLGILAGGYANPVLVLSALSLSLLVSYARAKIESLGERPKGIEIGERGERLLTLSIFSIFNLVGVGVLIVLILALITYIERITRYYNSLKG